MVWNMSIISYIYIISHFLYLLILMFIISPCSIINFNRLRIRYTSIAEIGLQTKNNGELYFRYFFF